MSATITEKRSVGIQPALRQYLDDSCLCAGEIQEPERILVSPLSLLVCLTCGKVATNVRRPAIDHA